MGHAFCHTFALLRSNFAFLCLLFSTTFKSNQPPDHGLTVDTRDQLSSAVLLMFPERYREQVFKGWVQGERRSLLGQNRELAASSKKLLQLAWLTHGAIALEWSRVFNLFPSVSYFYKKMAESYSCLYSHSLFQCKQS